MIAKTTVQCDLVDGIFTGADLRQTDLKLPAARIRRENTLQIAADGFDLHRIVNQIAEQDLPGGVQRIAATAHPGAETAALRPQGVRPQGLLQATQIGDGSAEAQISGRGRIAEAGQSDSPVRRGGKQGVDL